MAILVQTVTAAANIHATHTLKPPPMQSLQARPARGQIIPPQDNRGSR